MTRDPVQLPGLTPAETAVRLFLTCWIVYGLHFATNIVREIYPALALGDHFSFRVDEYARLHPDLFELDGRGWHINNNPGVSMVAAVPYALSRPIVDRIVERVRRSRAESGVAPPPYDSPWPMAREFYADAWRRGLDLKLGLGAFVMHAFCMAPASALGVVAMFFALRRVFASDRTALWLSVLYAFGTPVFFRTGYLNQNMMLGHVAFLGFVALWNPGNRPEPGVHVRYFLAGLAGGAAVLFDYTGAILLLGLFLYGSLKRRREAPGDNAVRLAGWFAAGAIWPLALLWFYQWRAFGHPFYPGQHWMPAVAWIDHGYRGMSLPQPDLLVALLFDPRYGLFVSSPLFLLALAAPFVDRGPGRRLPGLEFAAASGIVLGLWLFCGGVNYARLQFNTGVRHLAPIFPFIFILAAIVLVRLPLRLAIAVGVVSVAQSWCLAMYRDVEIGPLGVFDSVVQVFLGGFQLPALTTVSRIGGGLAAYFPNGVSPLPLFALAGALLYVIWKAPRGRAA
jgi:hypothetical protein